MNSHETTDRSNAPASALVPELWIGYVDEFPAMLREWTYRHLLSADEQARHDRYRHERDRHLHLTARLMTRAILSRCMPGVSPAEWRFRPGPHGKPEIAGPEPDRSGRWHFNVTHTEGVVVLAVSQNSPVGVDVERIDRPSNFVGLAGRFFASEEAAAITAAEESRRAALFYRIWTLKEAYVKAIGKGLAHPLDAFWFDPPDRFEPSPRLIVKTGTGEPRCEPAWQARVSHAGPDRAWIVSAVAASDYGTEAAKGVAWPIRPFRFDEAVGAIQAWPK